MEKQILFIIVLISKCEIVSSPPLNVIPRSSVQAFFLDKPWIFHRVSERKKKKKKRNNLLRESRG